MKRILLVGLALILMLALMLPAVAYAGSAGKGKTGKSGDGVTKRYAIVVGISDYPGEGSILEGGMDLFYADDDAVLMRKILKKQYGFDKVVLLTDEAATRDRILKEIAKLKKRVDKDDEVVFYFSGHCFPLGVLGGPDVGIATWRVKGDDAADVEMILDIELAGAFEGFGTDRIVFIFDCCYAGGMTELAGEGRIVCMAAEAGQQAAEVGEAYAALFPPGLPDPLGILDAENGLFTYLFAELGMMAGYADFNMDGYVTVEEAFDFAYGVLLEMTESGLLYQTPVMSIDGVLYP